MKIAHQTRKADTIHDIDWCTRFLSKLGDRDFFLNLPAFVSELWSYDFCMIFYYPARERPVPLFDGLTPEGYGHGVENYLRDTYVINPFYRALAAGLDPGLHAMSDLAVRIDTAADDTSALKVRHDSDEELGFVTMGWPENATEFMLAAPLVNESAIEVSISRLQSAEIGASQQAALRRLAPILVAGIQKHVELRPDTFRHPTNKDGTTFLLEDDAFRELTRREFEIVELILSGHSSPAIALHLDIALPTVKTHRRNIYRKLDISAQAELFARATKIISR